MKKFLRNIIACFFLLATFTVQAYGPTTPVIFDEDFGTNWGSWSWPSSPNPYSKSSTQAFKGTYSARMSFNAAWAGFSPGANIEFDTTGYTALVFAVYNESNAGQLYLRATKPDSPPGTPGPQTNPSIYIQDYTTNNVIPQGQWTWVRIPIADLLLGTDPKIYYLSIQNATTGVAYFDDIHFETNTTLYEGVKAQGGPTVQRWNWGSTITQQVSGADYYLDVNVTSTLGSVQFHEIQKYSGALPSSKYGMLTALFQKTVSGQKVYAKLVNESNAVFGSVNLENYVVGGVAALNTWYRVLIPFSDFGFGTQNLDGVIFSGDITGLFRLDDVKFLENFYFPLAGYTGTTVPITAAMDHSMSGAIFCSDGIVTNFVGEQGSSTYGSTASSSPTWSTNQGCGTIYGYRKSGGNVNVNGQNTQPYTDWYNYVFYDGHPGIDYKASIQTAVYATASGKITLSDCAAINSGISCTGRGSGFGKLQIDHGNYLTTSYNHLSYAAANIVVGMYVTKGQLVGYSGDTGVGGNPHLHLSVLWGATQKYIDPHGWKGSYPDPYTNAKNVCLWMGGC